MLPPSLASRLRSLAVNLTLSACSVAICLLLAELALRIALSGPARGGKEQQERNVYTEPDPLLGWRKIPGAEARYDRRDFQTRYRVNSRGLRGPEFAHERSPGVARVLALGDSFVEAFMVDDASTVTARLQAELAQRGCRAEVVNGGTVGYSTDQEFLFYREEGRRYRADLVVLFVYHNDIPYLVQEEYGPYPKPRLAFEDAGPRVTNFPLPRYEPPQRATPVAQPKPPSVLLEFVKDHLERVSARQYNRLAALGLWEPLRTLELNEEMRLYRVPELGHLRPAWSAFTWTLQSLARAVRDDGGELLLAYIPSRMEVDDASWELTQVRYALDEKYRRSAVAERVLQIARRVGVPELDFTAALKSGASRRAPVFFETDSHWNAHGQATAAAALADVVRPRLPCR
jgi:hypothetical protein